MLETLSTISSPRNLRSGQQVARVARAGEFLETFEVWSVVGWITPDRPAPGQSWGSGFLALESLDGSRLRVGPAKLVKTDFRSIGEATESEPETEFRGGPEDQINFHRGEGVEPEVRKTKSRAFWWDRD